MMIDDILSPLDGYLISINRNPETGSYMIDIALPNEWVFESTNRVMCEIINSNDIGKIIRVKQSQKLKEPIKLNEIIEFSLKIMEINAEINRKMDSFNQKLREMEDFIMGEKNKIAEEINVLKKTKLQTSDNNVDEFKSDGKSKPKTKKSIE